MAEQLIPTYNEDNIVHLDDREHIRRRPGMYIGKLGDGNHSDDGIYVLIKETIDNSIDEFRMSEGKVIEVSVSPVSASDASLGEHVRVRDYGRGIPLGKMVEAVSILNTGGKYDTKAFKKSVGLNGVGTKLSPLLFIIGKNRFSMKKNISLFYSSAAWQKSKRCTDDCRFSTSTFSYDTYNLAMIDTEIHMLDRRTWILSISDCNIIYI